MCSHCVGIAFREIKGKLFPSVGMKRPGEHVRVNFGQNPFVFDIDGMMSVSQHFPFFELWDFVFFYIAMNAAMYAAMA